MAELKDLKGVGEKRLAVLRSMGLERVEDVVRVYPRKYVDFNTDSRVEAVYDGEMCVFRCKLVSSPCARQSRRGMRYVQAELEAESGRLSAVWFNNRYVAKALSAGGEYVFFGRAQVREKVTLMNPQYREIKPGLSFQKLQPVYPLPPELTQTVFAEIVCDALRCAPLRSVIPPEILAREELTDINLAASLLHRPRDYADVAVGSARLALEDIVQLMVALRRVKAASCLARQNRYTDLDIAPFAAALPFTFTEAQAQAVDRIRAALAGDTVMNMLLQGDVGSGKTAVAFAAMYLAAANGYQAALMAPTEVLARQHYRKARELFGRFGWGVTLLTGGMTAAERRQAYEDVETGASRIVIGTHAVFQRAVTYRDLALVVTDEQHRFGVRQRAGLAEKGRGCDVLVMSATPIPRTLSLVMYGDMEVATLAAKPAGRREIKTSVVPKRKYEGMLAYIREQAKAGRQAYVICPAIEDEEDAARASVERVYREYAESAMPDVAVGFLHGGMPQAEKDRVMRDFAENKISVLVSTTVVEVGVDVPNATVLAVYDADRFGLSQLHQLRGRVGRGTEQSYCFLLTSSENPDSLARLKILASTNDGFEIANRDFELRGSGDMLGERQSGFVAPVLRRVKFDGRVVERARRIVEELPASPGYDGYFLENCSAEYRDLLTVTL